MNELEETLRLPATVKAFAGETPADKNNADVQNLVLESKNRSQENYASDTIPLSKVAWPMMEGLEETLPRFAAISLTTDELEDTLRLPAVILPMMDELVDTFKRPTSGRLSVLEKTVPSIGWINADGQRIILARALRMFGYGFASVLLGVTLASAGFTPLQVSLLLTIALIGDVVAIAFVALFADRFGRRRTLVLFALLMALAGIAFAFSQNLFILLLAAFFGTINPSSTSENAPFTAIEQAILPQTCSSQYRTDIFARYNLVAQVSGAIGGLAVTLPDMLHQVLGIGINDGIHGMFMVYGVVGLTAGAVFIGMSKQVEPLPIAKRRPATGRQVLTKQSRPIILRLASLFALDAFAGGLAVQALMAYWFLERFHVSLEELGLLFFGANLLAALSLPIAARLSKRFGMLKTMVFTHLPAQVFLILVPLMPTFWLAALFLLCRQSLSKMDVPTRQAYIMELVVPEERTAAASFTTMTRSVATSISPVVAGTLFTGTLLALGLPFLFGGGLEIFYDILLYRIFRNVKIAC